MGLIKELDDMIMDNRSKSHMTSEKYNPSSFRSYSLPAAS